MCKLEICVGLKSDISDVNANVNVKQITCLWFANM